MSEYRSGALLEPSPVPADAAVALGAERQGFVDSLSDELWAGARVALGGFVGVGKSVICAAVARGLRARGGAVAHVDLRQLTLGSGSQEGVEVAIRERIGDVQTRPARRRVLIVDHHDEVDADWSRVLSSIDGEPDWGALIAGRRSVSGDGLRPLVAPPLGRGSSLELFRRHGVHDPAAWSEPDIRAFVARLDGLPGAIILAARRASCLSSVQQLHDDTELLDALTAPWGRERRTTYDFAGQLEGFWRDLGEEDRAVLLASSVFRGHFCGREVEDILRDQHPGHVDEVVARLTACGALRACSDGVHLETPRLLASWCRQRQRSEMRPYWQRWLVDQSSLIRDALTAGDRAQAARSFARIRRTSPGVVECFTAEGSAADDWRNWFTVLDGLCGWQTDRASDSLKRALSSLRRGGLDPNLRAFLRIVGCSHARCVGDDVTLEHLIRELRSSATEPLHPGARFLSTWLQGLAGGPDRRAELDELAEMLRGRFLWSALAASYLAQLDRARGRPQSASATAARALATLEGAPPEERAWPECSLAFAELESWGAGAALERFWEARATGRDARAMRLELRAEFGHALCLLGARNSLALDVLERVCERARRGDLIGLSALAHGCAAVARALMGDFERASRHLSRAFTQRSRCAAPHEGRALELCRVIVELEQALAAAELDPWEGERAARTLESAGQSLAIPDDSLACEALVVGRVGRTLLVRASERLLSCQPWDYAFATGSTWFRTRDRHFDLQRHPVAAAVLDVLVQERLLRPGRAVGKDELFARGWGQSISDETSRDNRVFSIIARLRRLGLRPCLRERDGGYYLAEKVRVRRVFCPPSRSGHL